MTQDVVIVCGYGCKMKPELRDYLDRVVRFVNENKPECIILCGGFTQRKSVPGMSEARLMRNYVMPKIGSWLHSELLEESSYTTLENIKNSVKLINNFFHQKEVRVTIFCEATRALKVDMLTKHFLGYRANIETASWELMSPTLQIISTVFEWAAVRFPLLNSYFHWKRLRRAELI